MRRRGNDSETEPGQDSFLDVVANLVGILIILVVLIGSQAQSVWEEIRSAEKEQSAEMKGLESNLTSKQTERRKLESENVEIEQAIEAQQVAAKKLTQNRDRLQLLVQSLDETIAKRKESLNDDETQRADLIATTNRLKTELSQTVSYAEGLNKAQPQIGSISHLPTPIAKTVFGEEVHFQLKDGKLAFVPMNELIDEMRSEWKVKAKKLMQTSRTVETVGPIQNFRLQYTLALEQQSKRTENGIITAKVPSLSRFILIPVAEGLGEPIEQAMQPGSRFMRQIADLDPGSVTISIWVYPESFQYFNGLKKMLYERSFLCAGWPLPKNQPISASPNGFRAAAQ